MANTQVLPTGIQDTPGNYTLPPAQELTIGAVYASFDGSGAGGSYVPTLEIISDSGHKVLSVVQDTTIAAGVDAEASWAPFLRTLPASTSGGASLATMFRVHPAGGQNVAAGTTATLLWDATDFNLGSAFTTADHKTFTLALGVWWLWAEIELTWFLAGTTAGPSAVVLLDNGVDFYEHVLELSGVTISGGTETYTIGYLFDGRGTALKLRYDLHNNETDILQFRGTADLSAMGGILMQTP